MKDITFIKATEGPFNYNRSLDYNSPEFKKDIKIGIRTELLCKKNTDVVVISFLLKYEKTKDLIFSYNVNAFYEVKEWKKILNEQTSENIKNLEEVEKMLEITIGYVRGSLAVQTKNTPIANLYLPILPIKDIQNNIVMHVDE